MSEVLTLADAYEKLATQRRNQCEWAAKSCYQDMRRVDTTFHFVQAAQAEGLPFSLPGCLGDATNPTYEVTSPSHWRVIHDLVGVLESAGTSPADDDARKRLVWAFLTPKCSQYAHIRFKFKKKLPKSSKCKVKRVRTSGYSYTTVVCD